MRGFFIRPWVRFLGITRRTPRIHGVTQAITDCQINKLDTMEEVNITAYDDRRHHEAFKTLNERWIRDIFGVVEDIDHYELDHPV